jgi:hypothetical protein
MVPIAALFLVDIDANEGFGVRAKNLAQAVLEYDAMTFTTTAGHVVISCGLLLDIHVHAACPLTESLPNSHGVHAPLPFTALNEPAAHAVHGTSPPGPV